MQTQTKLSFITFIFLISFASVNAVLFTPALPNITTFFAVTEGFGQQTITWFLIGYTAGQLIYGPLANRLGRKSALYVGILLQILGCGLCATAGALHLFSLLVIGRFIMALGSGAGLKITFTLINESHDAPTASRIMSYLMIAFAITPALSVMLGGMLNTHFGWQSTFYASAIYGAIVLILAVNLPERKKARDYDALLLKPLANAYLLQFKNPRLICAGLLMGGGTSIIYVFATLAPFIAMNHFNMSSNAYGQANLLPPIGLIIGSIISAQLTKKMPLAWIIRLGVSLTLAGSILMLILLLAKQPPLLTLFVPMILCYAGLGFINANVSSLAISAIEDKANASAVLNFTNMGLATLVLMVIGTIHLTPLLLPIIYIGICLLMFSITRQIIGKRIPIAASSMGTNIA